MTDNKHDPYAKYNDFKGIEGDELTAAYRRHRHNNVDSRQFGGSTFSKIPRKAKHRGSKVDGVRIR